METGSWQLKGQGAGGLPVTEPCAEEGGSLGGWPYCPEPRKGDAAGNSRNLAGAAPKAHPVAKWGPQRGIWQQWVPRSRQWEPSG